MKILYNSDLHGEGYKMEESLENQVREGIIDRTTNETYRLMQKPKYQNMFRDITRTIMAPVFSALGDEVDDELNELDEEMDILFSNPEQLKQMIYQSVRNYYISREQTKAFIEGWYEELNEDEFGEAALEKLKEANEGVYYYVDLQNRIVDNLVETAKKEGLEKALTEEAEIEVIREIFPTADGYINFSLNGFQDFKEYLADVQKAMLLDGEIGGIMYALYDGIQEGTGDLFEQLLKERTYEKAKKIYGGNFGGENENGKRTK